MALAQYLVGSTPARLSTENITWGPSPQRPVIADLSFEVAPGEMLAVVGPNGSGKSSLLRCLYRFHRPTTGSIRLDGVDIWQMRPRHVAQRIGSVLQEGASDFGLTVAEVVELGLSPHFHRSATSQHSIDYALELLGLAHLRRHDFASLSGGEKQRVMIARALVQKPDLLILDEPTSHLDIRHELEVLALLVALPTTVVVSMHDLSLASAHADRVLLLDHGRPVQLGTPADVLTPSHIGSTFGVEVTIDDYPVTGRPRFSFHLNRSA